MGIRLSWFDGERRAIYWEFEPDWTIAQFYEAFEQSAAMAKQYPFYVVADVRNVHSMSSGSLSIFIMRHATVPENYRGTVVVNANRYMERLFKLMNRQPFTKDRFTMVSTLDEARVIVGRTARCV